MSAKKVGPPLHRQITRVSKVNISFNFYFDVICLPVVYFLVYILRSIWELRNFQKIR